jgi:hypothetical protein
MTAPAVNPPHAPCTQAPPFTAPCVILAPCSPSPRRWPRSPSPSGRLPRRWRARTARPAGTPRFPARCTATALAPSRGANQELTRAARPSTATPNAPAARSRPARLPSPPPKRPRRMRRQAAKTQASRGASQTKSSNAKTAANRAAKPARRWPSPMTAPRCSARPCCREPPALVKKAAKPAPPAPANRRAPAQMLRAAPAPRHQRAKNLAKKDVKRARAAPRVAIRCSRARRPSKNPANRRPSRVSHRLPAARRPRARRTSWRPSSGASGTGPPPPA